MHHIFSDRLILHVLDLNQVELATEEDQLLLQQQTTDGSR